GCVADLGEFAIPLSYGIEVGRSGETDNRVHFLSQLLANRKGGDGNRDNHFSRVLLAQRLHGNPHGGAGGDAVIHQYYGMSVDVQDSTTSTIEMFAALKLLCFMFINRFHLLRRKVQTANDRRIQQTGATGCDGADGQFLLAGKSEFADEKYIQRSM